MGNRPRDLPPVPTKERFRDALRILAYSMPKKHRRLLEKHYRSAGHTATATELAKLVDYPDWNSVNLQYGTFAAKLADRMHWTLPPDTQASYAVAWFEKPDGPEEHWRWHMHDELVAALEELRWVTPLQTA
ncbi:MAG TPA: hypothetical protein VNR86_04410 [Sphingomicrobium sp.]|nr:hypothetical protein [Sphingomicrobium sp.]